SAATVAVAWEAAQRPVAVVGLVLGDPFEAGGDSGLGVGVAAPFAEELFASRAAAAVEAARNKLAPHAAWQTDRVAGADAVRIVDAAAGADIAAHAGGRR